jgi:FkbM family methyltransferase
MVKKFKKKNKKHEVNNFLLRQKIFYLIFFFFSFIKKICKKKRFIPLTFPFNLNQVFFDKLTNKLIRFQIRDYSDWTIVDQIFYSEEYSLEKFHRYKEINKYYKNILKKKLKPLIIDCGGHIGLATKYFSIVYPNSKIIYIEPSKENCKQARKNNLKNQPIEFLNKAIGPNNCKGFIYDPKFGNNAYRIKKNHKGNIDIISINQILKKLKKRDEIPFIIKIDIEGFEKELFSKNTEWVDKFPILIIELHDWMLPKKSNSNNFLSFISTKNRDFLYSGENIVSISNKINFNFLMK